MAVLFLDRETELEPWSGDGGGATFDDLLSGVWEGLIGAASSTACPVCRSVLEPRWSAGAGVVGGRCRDCGSELS
jgi:hypothetical protein